MEKNDYITLVIRHILRFLIIFFVIHIPVLFHEVRDAYLKVSPRKYVIDATQ